MTNDRSLALSPEEFDSLREVSKGDAQREIPQLPTDFKSSPCGIESK
jgi:hypothetical protein